MQKGRSLSAQPVKRKLAWLLRTVRTGKLPAWAAGERYLLAVSTQEVLDALSGVRTLEADGNGHVLAFSVSAGIPPEARETGILRELSSGNAVCPYGEPFLRLFPAMRAAAALVKIADAVRETPEVCPDGYAEQITQLYRARELDWERIHDTLSRVERALQADPSGTYPRCDRETRAWYREAVRCGAKEQGMTEEAFVEDVLFRARNAKDPGERDISFFLFPETGRRRGVGLHLFLYALTLLSSAGAALFLLPFGIWRAAVCGWFLLLPFYALFRECADILAVRFGKRTPILRLELDKLPDEGRTLVVITTLLAGEERDKMLFDNLERFYLRNRDKNLRVGLLGDFREADCPTTAEDERIAEYAAARIDALNTKYRKDGAPFCLFLRPRTYSAGEKRFFGWERKRGAVLTLVRYLRGKAPEDAFFCVRKECALSDIAYLCTLDSDTELPSGAVRAMVSAMLHPRNAPIVRNGRVVSGIGMLQPAMAVSLSGAAESRFTLLCAGKGGADPYTRFSTDGESVLYGEGSFCGKGLFSVDAYLTVLDGAFPEETVLSHDFLEGQRLSCMNFPAVMCTDRIPGGVISYFERQSRWVRGDIQALRFAFPACRGADGKKRKNPVPLAGRLRVVDHALYALIPAAVLRCAFACALFGFPAPVTALLWLGAFSSRLLRPLLLWCGPRAWHSFRRRFWGAAYTDRRQALLRLCFQIQFSAYEGWINLRAVLTALWRMLVTHRNLLSWVTAGEAELRSCARGGVWGQFVGFRIPILLGGLLLVFAHDPVSLLVGALWMLTPLSAGYLSKGLRRQNADTGKECIGATATAEKKTEKERSEASAITEKDTEKKRCRTEAAAVWRFFAEQVGEQTCHLPPDNVQWFPFAMPKTAERTSPTNIGLYLLSCIAARDFFLISTEELTERLSAALDTLSRMERFRGHFYNWYRTDTAERIGAPYLSAVDSGNLVCAALAAAGGARDYLSEDTRLAGVCSRLEALAFGTDFSFLYDKNRALLHLGYDTEQEKPCGGYYDLYCSEARSAVYFAIAAGQLPQTAWQALGRPTAVWNRRLGVSSWSGSAFEYFMPALWLPVPENSFSAEILHTAMEEQMRERLLLRTEDGEYAVFGKSEGAYFAFDADRNFCYQPCGVPSLGLAGGLGKERLVMPYASFLMLPFARGNERTRLFSNLDTMEALGMRGLYGYYEALDSTHSRLGGGFAVVRSVMAHHLGMSLAALANTAFDGCFVRRFLQNPEMEAAQELLWERIPTDARAAVPPYLRNGTADMGIRAQSPLPKTGEPTLPVLDGLPPRYAVLSDTQMAAVVSSGGNVSLSDGGMTVIRDGDCVTDLPLTAYFYAEGQLYSSARVSSADDRQSRVSRFFSCDDRGAVWRADYPDGVTAETDLQIAAETRTAVFRFSLSRNGTPLPFTLTFFFRPVLDEEKSYRVHPAFSDLFLVTGCDTENRTVRIRRSPRELPESGGTRQQRHAMQRHAAAHLTVTAPELQNFRAVTDASELLSARFRAEDVFRLAKMPSVIGKSCGDPEKISALVPFVLLQGECTGNCAVSLRMTDGAFPGSGTAVPDQTVPREETLAAALHAELRMLCGNPGAADETVSSLLYAVRNNGGTHVFRDGTHLFRDIAGTETEDAWYPTEKLWKHGISGDLPIFYLTVGADTADARVQKLLYAWKYLLISGIRCDLVLGVEETDVYSSPVGKRVRTLIEVCGVSFFVSSGRGDGGIFPVPIEDARRDGIPARSVWRDGKTADEELIQEEVSVTEALSAGKPDIPVRCGVSADAVTISRGRKHVPWQYLLSNGVFGTMLCDGSLGFTFFGNSRECRVTPWYSEALQTSGDGGMSAEQLLLSVSGGGKPSVSYDLCRNAEVSVWHPESASFCGTVPPLAYSVDVRIPDRRKRKEIAVTVSNNGDTAVSVTLRYRLEPLFGVLPRDGGVISYHIGDGGTLSFTSLSSEACRGYRAVVTLSGAEQIRAGRDSGRTLFCDGTVTLPAGGERTLVFALSVLNRGERTADRVLPARPVPLPKKSVRTGDPVLDALAGTWLPVQIFRSRLWGRCGYWQPGGAYGFRDQLQDAMNVLSLDSSVCKRQILRCAAHQYTEGDVQLWWHALPGRDRAKLHRGIRSRYADDLLWLPLALSLYSEAENDLSLAKTGVYYLESPVLAAGERERYEEPLRSKEKESVYMHGVRAIEQVLSRGMGTHGLPLFCGGDWNDGMNRVGSMDPAGGNGGGESVWMGQFLLLVLGKWLPLARTMGDDDGAEKYGQEMKRLAAVIEDEAWNGQWYRRAWYDDGTPMGNPGDAAAEIDLLPQAFAAIVNEKIRLPDLSCPSANGGKKPFSEERVHTAMLAAYERLFDRERGIFRLLNPPFIREDTEKGSGTPPDGEIPHDPGYIAAYPPGIRENGGQYTHAAVWGAMGLYAVGEREKGDAVLRAMDPAKRYFSDPDRYQKEPYALCGDILTAAGRYGEGGWSQYTGAAGWYLRLLTERFGESQ